RLRNCAAPVPHDTGQGGRRLWSPSAAAAGGDCQQQADDWPCATSQSPVGSLHVRPPRCVSADVILDHLPPVIVFFTPGNAMPPRPCPQILLIDRCRWTAALAAPATRPIVPSAGSSPPAAGNSSTFPFARSV